MKHRHVTVAQLISSYDIISIDEVLYFHVLSFSGTICTGLKVYRESQDPSNNSYNCQVILHSLVLNEILKNNRSLVIVKSCTIVSKY